MNDRIATSLSRPLQEIGWCAEQHASKRPDTRHSRAFGRHRHLLRRAAAALGTASNGGSNFNVVLLPAIDTVGATHAVRFRRTIHQNSGHVEKGRIATTVQTQVQATVKHDDTNAHERHFTTLSLANGEGGSSQGHAARLQQSGNFGTIFRPSGGRRLAALGGGFAG